MDLRDEHFIKNNLDKSPLTPGSKTNFAKGLGRRYSKTAKALSYLRSFTKWVLIPTAIAAVIVFSGGLAAIPVVGAGMLATTTTWGAAAIIASSIALISGALTIRQRRQAGKNAYQQLLKQRDREATAIEQLCSESFEGSTSRATQAMTRDHSDAALHRSPSSSSSLSPIVENSDNGKESSSQPESFFSPSPKSDKKGNSDNVVSSSITFGMNNNSQE